MAGDVSAFFDKFFVCVAAVVLSLTAVDWLLGKERRGAIKQGVGNFWTFLQYKPLSSAFGFWLSRLGTRLCIFYGSAWLSGKFFLRTFITSAVVAILFGMLWRAGVLAWLVPPTISLSSVSTSEFASQVLSYWETFLIPAAVTLCTGWISLTLLVLALRSDIDDNITWVKLGRACLLYILRTGLWWIATFAVTYGVIHVFIYDGMSDQEADVLLFGQFCALLAVAWPIHIVWILLLSLVALAISRPVVQPIVSLVLNRLYESDKGVLTQVSVALGAIAKLTQEALKHLL